MLSRWHRVLSSVVSLHNTRKHLDNISKTLLSSVIGVVSRCYRGVIGRPRGVLSGFYRGSIGAVE
eukprot:3921680-Pyramimonas_sp.AAC.1